MSQLRVARHTAKLLLGEASKISKGKVWAGQQILEGHTSHPALNQEEWRLCVSKPALKTQEKSRRSIMESKSEPRVN